MTAENTGTQAAGFKVERLVFLAKTGPVQLPVSLITTARARDRDAGWSVPPHGRTWEPGSRIVLDPGDRWWVKVDFSGASLPPRKVY